MRSPHLDVKLIPESFFSPTSEKRKEKLEARGEITKLKDVLFGDYSNLSQRNSNSLSSRSVISMPSSSELPTVDHMMDEEAIMVCVAHQGNS